MRGRRFSNSLPRNSGDSASVTNEDDSIKNTVGVSVMLPRVWNEEESHSEGESLYLKPETTIKSPSKCFFS